MHQIVAFFIALGTVIYNTITAGVASRDLFRQVCDGGGGGGGAELGPPSPACALALFKIASPPAGPSCVSPSPAFLLHMNPIHSLAGNPHSSEFPPHRLMAPPHRQLGRSFLV